MSTVPHRLQHIWPPQCCQPHYPPPSASPAHFPRQDAVLARFVDPTNMDEQAGVNLVSRQHDHHHLDFTKSNCTDAADHRSQFFSSVFASAPGRLVIPTIIMTSHGGTGNGNGGPGTGGGGGVQQAGPHQDDTTMMALNSECIVVPASDVGVVDRTHRQTSAKMHSGCPEVAATNVVPAANAVPAASCSHVDDSGDRGAAKRCLATMASASGRKATRAPRDVSRTAGRSLQVFVLGLIVMCIECKLLFSRVGPRLTFQLRPIEAPPRKMGKARGWSGI